MHSRYLKQIATSHKVTRFCRSHSTNMTETFMVKAMTLCRLLHSRPWHSENSYWTQKPFTDDSVQWLWNSTMGKGLRKLWIVPGHSSSNCHDFCSLLERETDKNAANIINYCSVCPVSSFPYTYLHISKDLPFHYERVFGFHWAKTHMISFMRCLECQVSLLPL